MEVRPTDKPGTYIMYARWSMSQEEGLDFWKVSRLERVDWESLGLMLRRAMRLAKRSDERSEVMSEAK